MGARVYTGAATPTTITGSITNVSTSVTIASATNWLTSGQFSVVIDPGLAGEEKCLATLSGTTLTFVTRGYDNTTAASHNSGAVIYPVPTAIDFSEANTHVNASSAVHGVAGTIVGTTDTQTLTNKDLSSSTNIFPAQIVAGKNAVINGDMTISQRGQSFTYSASGYTLDRYAYAVASAIPSGTITQQAFTAGSAPVAGYEAQYFLRSNITAANGCTNVVVENRMEDVRTFAGQTVTVSFWVKTDAATTFNVTIQQNFGSGGSGTVGTAAISSQATTTGWVRYSATVTVPSISGKTIGAGSYLSVYFVLPNSGANIRVGTFDLWGVQLELGSVATTFSRASGSIGGELALCQRYYQRTSLGVYVALGIGKAESATSMKIFFTQMVMMRTIPSVLDYGGSISVTTSSASASSLTIDVASPWQTRINATSAGMTAGQILYLYDNGLGTAYIGLSAEL